MSERDPIIDAVTRLRLCAEGRREYALAQSVGHWKNELNAQADALEQAAQIVEGDITPMYGLMPSWRWTAEMEESLGGSGDGSMTS